MPFPYLWRKISTQFIPVRCYCPPSGSVMSLILFCFLLVLWWMLSCLTYFAHNLWVTLNEASPIWYFILSKFLTWLSFFSILTHCEIHRQSRYLIPQINLPWFLIIGCRSVWLPSRAGYSAAFIRFPWPWQLGNNWGPFPRGSWEGRGSFPQSWVHHVCCHLEASGREL